MWQMDDKVRVLTDAEWELFAEGLASLCRSIEGDALHERAYPESEVGTETAIPVFDALTPAQQVALLADVGTALCDPTVRAPAHTLARDGAVAAVFAWVRKLLRKELAGDETKPDGMRMRQFILAACRGRSSRSRLPFPTRKSWDAWEELLEGIESQIHWDQGRARGVFDLVPETQISAKSKRAAKGYLQPTPREPNEAGVIAARQALSHLLGWGTLDENGLYPGLMDNYHDFIIGPCSPKEAKQWEKHPWVDVIGLVLPNWECGYSLWLAELRPAVPKTPFTVLLSPPETKSQKGRRGRPARPMNPTQTSDAKAEQRGTQWVLRKGKEYWCNLLYDRWDEEKWAVLFSTEEIAYAAYIHASRMFEEREKRRHDARDRLNLPLDEEDSEQVWQEKEKSRPYIVR